MQKLGNEIAAIEKYLRGSTVWMIPTCQACLIYGKVQTNYK